MNDDDIRSIDLIVNRRLPKAGSLPVCYRGAFAAAFVELARALRRRDGYVLVTGKRGVGKSSFVKSVLAGFDAHATATVSAVTHPPCHVLEKLALGRRALGRGTSVTEKRADLLSIVEEARAAGRPIVLVVEDAEWATAGSLHALRVALEMNPRIDEVVQVILVGNDDLEVKLRKRAARAIAARIGTRITIGTSRDEVVASAGAPPNTDRRGRLASVLRSARRALASAAPAAAAVIVFLASGIDGPTRPAFAASTAARTPSTADGRIAGDLVPDACRHRAGPALSAICEQLERASQGDAATGAEVEPDGASGHRARDAAPAPGDGGDDAAPADEHAPQPRHRSYPVVLGALDLDHGPMDTNREKRGRLVVDRISTRDVHASAVAMVRFDAATSPGTSTTDVDPVHGSGAAGSISTVTLPQRQVALHVAAFRDFSQSLALKEALERDYDHVYVRKVSDSEGSIYRVRIGRFASAEDATPVAERLAAAGYSAYTTTEE